MSPNDESGPFVNRRRTLKILGSGIGVGVSSVPVAGTGRQDWGNDNWLGNLLPAHQTGVLEPEVHQDIPNPDETFVDITSQDAYAYELGYLNVATGATLAEGRGELAMGGAAWVESTWNPSEAGQHQVEVEYKHSSDQMQRTLQSDANVVLTTEPTLAVINDDTGEIVTHSSRIGSNGVSAEMQEYLIERLLETVIIYILLPGVGTVGKVIAKFILGPVVDHIVEVRPEGGTPTQYGRMSLSFNAQPDTTYRFKFTASNGFSGQLRDEDDSIFAESSSLYELSRFHVESTGWDFGASPEGSGSGSGVEWPPSPDSGGIGPW